MVLQGYTAKAYRWLGKKIAKFTPALLIMFGIFLALLFIASFIMRYDLEVNVVYMELDEPFLHITDNNFLSVALDSVVIANGFKNFNMKDLKLKKLVASLAPGYFRIGGNLADRLVFAADGKYVFKYSMKTVDGGDCAYSQRKCEALEKPNYTMSGLEWLDLNKFVSDVGLEIIFDLNVLLRFENGSWNPSNAETLIQFSDKNNLTLNWELGNEPDAFFHEFQVKVAPQQLAADFTQLRHILQKYTRFNTSLLIGPDVTRPQEHSEKSIKYLTEFLKMAGHEIDAVTWHQYYFNGRLAKPYYYVNTEVFNMLIWQAGVINNISKSIGLNKPIWLGETADAWGGGADGFSSAYLSTFIWLDKLGLAAKIGVDVVVRQSIVEGYYALIDEDYNPTPNWWISVIYKLLVGPQVVPCYIAANLQVRLYCHCAKSRDSSHIVFGMNLKDTSAKIRLETKHGILNERIGAYILTPFLSLYTRAMMLNYQLLKLTDDFELPPILPKMIPAQPYILLPPYSIAFLKLPLAGLKNQCRQDKE